VAQLCAGRQGRLLAGVFSVASLITAVLSLDATVVLLTPVVFATAARLGARPRPHVYATAHLANTASLLRPVSNLTNLLAFTAAGLSFGRFTAVMTLPWLAAVFVEFVVLRWRFAKELRPRDHPKEPPPKPEVPIFVLVVLVMTLAGFAVTSLFDVAPAWAALAGAVVLGVRSLAQRRSTVSGIVNSVNVPF